MAANDIVESIICKIKNIHRMNVYYDLNRSKNILNYNSNKAYSLHSDNKLKQIIYNKQKTIRQSQRERVEERNKHCMDSYDKAVEAAKKEKDAAKSQRQFRLDQFHRNQFVDFHESKNVFLNKVSEYGQSGRSNKEKHIYNRKRNYVIDRLRYFKWCCNEQVLLNQDLELLLSVLFELCDKHKIWSTETS